jgi:hypothetical protein
LPTISGREPQPTAATTPRASGCVSSAQTRVDHDAEYVWATDLLTSWSTAGTLARFAHY